MAENVQVYRRTNSKMNYSAVSKNHVYICLPYLSSPEDYLKYLALEFMLIVSSWQTIPIQNKQKICFIISLYTIANKFLPSQCHLFPPNYEMLNKAVILPQPLLPKSEIY